MLFLLYGDHSLIKNLANLAIKIERNILKESVGFQDQIFSAFGGFNSIKFKMNEDYAVEDLLSNKKIDKLNKSSILIWSGQQRLGQNLEKGKINKIKKNLLDKNLKKIQKFQKKHMRNL